MNKAKRFESVIISTILLTSIFSILLSASFMPDVSAVLCKPIQHSSISITSDSGFTDANGVVSGSGTASDPYIIGNLKIDDLSLGYGLKIDNTSGGITKYFNIQCMQSSFSGLTSGDKLVWLVNIHQNTVISDISGNSAEQGATTGLEVDESSNITMNNLSFNKMGLDGVLINDSNNITISESKLKAVNNGLTIQNSHDITIGKKCNLSGPSGCNDFTYDDGRGVYILNSYNILVQYTKTTADDTGGILVDGTGSFNVTLTNGVTSGDGSICEHGIPTGDRVDTIAGIAIINGAHDVTISHYIANGDTHFSLMNGGDGVYINPCTDSTESVSVTSPGGANLVVCDVSYQNEYGFIPVPTSSC